MLSTDFLIWCWDMVSSFTALHYRCDCRYPVFMERDNDTFKNLRTIPVTSTQMVLAKIIVLFLFELFFVWLLPLQQFFADLEH